MYIKVLLKHKSIIMKVLKVVELMSSSEKGWEDATQVAIKKASESIKNIKSAWVKEQSVTVNDNKIKEYRVTLNVTFAVD